MPRSPALSPDLKHLVRDCVALLGQVIRQELGENAYRRIEDTRRAMTRLRGASARSAIPLLQAQFRKLEQLNPGQRRDFARAYTLMLELMNACENAYRTHRIRARTLPLPARRPDAIIYVLTAHPTEARSPENIRVFHRILEELTLALEAGRIDREARERLRHWISIAWRTPIVRARKPRVQDEAEHLYSTLLREEILRSLLTASRELAPVFIRSWVGGDKDGHPGVNERVFLASLSLSRRELVDFVRSRLLDVSSTSKLIRSEPLANSCGQALSALNLIRAVSPGDAGRLLEFRSRMRDLLAHYLREVSGAHPALEEVRQLLRVFPALVVPLEFRESSDSLAKPPIARMLRTLESISRGADPRWYVRGLIISMTERIEHVRAGTLLVSRTLGGLRIPVIPLFEQDAALASSPQIVRAMLKDHFIRRAIETEWGGYLEVMVGYSDSAKESGVLPSRLRIAETMHALERLCLREGVTPLFFQGSGGSVDRGGGTVSEQTAWWPASALRNYKVTLQGEMVERSLANPEITRGQLERIAQSAGSGSATRERRLSRSSLIEAFAARVAKRYQSKIRSAELLDVVKLATPYPDLDALRIGSRPTQRASALSVGGLRAIPWVLCWTQTRVLFPTWWGIGGAWRETPARERARLARAYRENPLFSTYVRALGFTLAKVELPVWRIYLENSALTPGERERIWDEFVSEHEAATEFTLRVSGERGLLAWQPWLRESITLRAPMIHPLNLLQILAIHDRDFELLRLTVTGISSGMMTTG